MNEIIHLHQLQTIDHQLEKIEIRLVEIGKLLESNQDLLDADKILQIARDATAEAMKKLKNIEETSEKQRIKIETDEASLYSGRIHNPKELQDLQTEIKSLKKHQVVLEEQQLEAMQVLEDTESLQQAAATNHSQALALFIEQSSTLQGEQTSLVKQKERLLSERSAAINSISSENFEMYLKLRDRKRGTAVANIIGGGCSACGSTLTPADIQAARSPSKITFCSSCGRILYAG